MAERKAAKNFYSPDCEPASNSTKVKQFMNILEQLPRLCSPTICGTLSQPTTKTERASTRRAEIFEWSLEQRAILSPANITTDTEGTDEWPANMTDLNPAWRQQESEMFFSQRTIAPSPMITPSTRAFARRPPTMSGYQDLKEDEDETEEEDDRDADEADIELDDDDEDDVHAPHENDDDDDIEDIDHIEEDEDDHIDDEHGDEDRDFSMGQEDEELMDDNLYFSPQPLKSSQSQQRMSIFSPNTFSRVMEDENTLQSTPKTTTGSQRARVRNRNDMLD